MLILLNILCFQWGKFSYESSADIELTSSASLASLSLLGSTQSNDPLQPQQGNAVNLPSIRVEDPKLDRSIYGGAGDKKHLGGFTEVDIHGISPYVWRRMVTEYGIKSVIDVGCGRGVSTLWFHLNGLDALCVEGSHDAYVRSMLPDPSTQMVEHDFSRGPWWPSKTYDAVWCVEFLEHVGRNLHQNYLPIFRKAAIIFATHSQWGGWHHVEVHQDDWWIRKFELYGFKYMPDMTAQVREEARQEAFHGPLAVNGEKPNPQNLYNVLVFFNPAVGALPQHAHLFAEPGCFKSRINGNSTLKDCGTGVGADGETPLPPEYLALPIVEANQKRWEERVQSFIQPKTRL
jgi:hypothetical protein